MKTHTVLSIVLFIFVMFGLLGGLRISYINFVGANSCPHFGPIALCYVVTLGYLSMFFGLCISKLWFSPVLFWTGWTFVFLIALVGTGFELVITNVCPQGFRNIPLCFLSLALSTITGLLFKVNSTKSDYSKG